MNRLVRDFDRLPSLGAGVGACPMDNGSEVLAELAYPRGQSVTISFQLNGCLFATNGDLTRTALPAKLGRALIAKLKQLTRSH